MSAPLPDTTRNTITSMAAAGTPRNVIARTVGCSPATVSKICKDAGINFNRTATKAATAAKVADAKARRAAISETLLTRAEQFLDDMTKPMLVYSFGGKENDYNEHLLDRPPTPAIRDLMSTVSTALQRHEAIVKLDQANDDAQVKSMLHSLAESLGIHDA